MFGRGAEVLGHYVCLTRVSSFLPFLIKFLEASLEFCLLLELVFPDLDLPGMPAFNLAFISSDTCLPKVFFTSTCDFARTTASWSSLSFSALGSSL